MVNFFFSSRRRHTRYWRDWSSDVCSSDLDDDTVDWLPISLVRNGVVVARIQLGDFDGARSAFKAYSGNSDEDPFTARVLAAYLLDQERRHGEDRKSVV